MLPGFDQLWQATERSDLVGRAMRLIADGVVDREGVAGLAARLGYGERHVHRQLVAAGFGSVRQFNDTIREVSAAPPGMLRARSHGDRRTPDRGTVSLRLPYRRPLAAEDLLAFFARRAVTGVEEVAGGVYRRSLPLPHGPAVIELEPGTDHVAARYRLADIRDLAVAVQRSRRLLDLDSDPGSVRDALGPDAVIGAEVRRAPGRRVPGHADAHELAIRAVLGQQVSVAGAATLAARLVAAYGEPLARPVGSVTHLFPSASALTHADPERMAMPVARRRALLGLAAALAGGELVLDSGSDRAEARRRLIELPGIGPWTVEYVAMRALRDADAFLPTDLGVRRALEHLGRDGSPPAAAALAERWRPYRADALNHPWGSLASASPAAPRPARARGQRAGRALAA